MAIKQQELHKIVAQQFPDAKITITDLVGDEDHYQIEIIDKVFYNKTKIQQHRIVHKALDSVLNQRLHAIQLKTSES